jgi:uncharacterized membrane protein YbhN (UPF0104 family)
MTDEDTASADPLAAAVSVLRVASNRDDAGPVPFFVSDRVAPRRRRSSDVGRLLLGSLAFTLLGWAASNEPDFDLRVFESLQDLPGWVRSLAWFGYSAAGVGALVIVIVSVVVAGLGRGLVRDLILALFLATLLASIGSRIATEAWPDLLPEFFSIEEYPAFPAMRTTLVLVVALVLSPYVNVGIRHILRWCIVAVVVTPLLLGLTTVTSLFGGLALSFASVATVRLAFGSPEGLPSIGRLRKTLADVGIPVTDLRYRPDQPGTVGLATATAEAGGPVDIKIYGVDAANSQRAERIWRALWYRTAGPAPGAGRSEQAQHEALALLSAGAADVNVPKMIRAGMTPDGDVLVVTGGADGRAIVELEGIDDSMLRSMWTELTALHRHARITHGSLGPNTIRVTTTGIELVDFAHASMFPTEQQLATDVVSMLAIQATVVGPERALDAVVDTLDRADLEICLPYVQGAVIEPHLRTELKAAGVKVKTLRAGLAERLEVEPSALAPVKRVQVKDVVIAVAAIIAATSLITQITDVGIDTLGDELAGASIGWFVVTFLIKMVSYTTAYLGMRALISQTLPFLPTTLLQSAKSFVGLVVPSMVGRIGMDIRFLQKLGVPLATASTQGPVISLIGFVAEVILLLLSAWSIGQEVDTDGLADIDAGGLIAIAIAIVVIGGVVVLAVPKLRATVVPVVKDALSSVRAVVTSPRILGAIFSSEVLDRLFGALALGATVAAFGADVPFAALVFVSVGTGLLAGLAPVPGGIGVAEATMSGLLTAVGLPAEQAVTIAITYRMITAYLPPVLGFFSLRWLTDKGYL